MCSKVVHAMSPFDKAFQEFSLKAIKLPRLAMLCCLFDMEVNLKPHKTCIVNF